MVEVSSGFKMGIVKFIGETQFAPGKWIGLALERPSGEYYNYRTIVGMPTDKFWKITNLLSVTWQIRKHTFQNCISTYGE